MRKGRETAESRTRYRIKVRRRSATASTSSLSPSPPVPPPLHISVPFEFNQITENVSIRGDIGGGRTIDPKREAAGRPAGRSSLPIKTVSSGPRDRWDETHVPVAAQPARTHQNPAESTRRYLLASRRDASLPLFPSPSLDIS